MNLDQLEIQLKKRLASEYKWGRKQADIWETHTDFVCSIPNFEDVVARIYDEFNTHARFVDLRNYALNRWYEYYSSLAVEHIFHMHPKVRKVKDTSDREKYFYINGIAFDHKTITFPSEFHQEVNKAMLDPKEFLKWVYKDPSNQQYSEAKYRLFLVLHQDDGEHWRLKAELNWIKACVDTFLDNYKEIDLISFKTSGVMVKTGLIFGVK